MSFNWVMKVWVQSLIEILSKISNYQNLKFNVNSDGWKFWESKDQSNWILEIKVWFKYLLVLNKN